MGCEFSRRTKSKIGASIEPFGDLSSFKVAFFFDRSNDSGCLPFGGIGARGREHKAKEWPVGSRG